jgi:hypothetical protein
MMEVDADALAPRAFLQAALRLRFLIQAVARVKRALAPRPLARVTKLQTLIQHADALVRLRLQIVLVQRLFLMQRIAPVLRVPKFV